MAGGVEGADVEDAGEERPAEGDIGNEDGCGGFANVPIEVDKGPIRFCEVIVAVEDGGENLRREKGSSLVGGAGPQKGNVRRRNQD